ncbi:hypothetical protein OSTOST_21555, partial [Ostertagia ostertagi]
MFQPLLGCSACNGQDLVETPELKRFGGNVFMVSIVRDYHGAPELGGRQRRQIHHILTTDDHLILSAEEHSEDNQHQQHNDNKVSMKREGGQPKVQQPRGGKSIPDVYDTHDSVDSNDERINTSHKAVISKNSAGAHAPERRQKPRRPFKSASSNKQMIVTLLRKFRVADNPRKFALYECAHENDEQTCTLLRKMTRISDDVCPLKVVLSWQNAKCGRALVLQENDTGDIL